MTYSIHQLKCTTRFVFYLRGAAFTWPFKKQPIIALLSYKAKYIVASFCVCHTICLKKTTPRTLCRKRSQPRFMLITRIEISYCIGVSRFARYGTILCTEWYTRAYGAIHLI
ncbi:unnamed protein product [Musa textilis]